MITKYDVGEEVCVKLTVYRISWSLDEGVQYALTHIKNGEADFGSMVWLNESELLDQDFVTAETYESEINELKSIIEEKDKEIARLKAPYIEIKRKDFSHHPQENIYAKSLKNYDNEKEYDKEDWRLP